jgi:lysophospholipase L1-like esterase
MSTKVFCWSFACLLFGLLFTISVQAQNKATTPVDRQNEWWINRHAANVENMNQGNIDLLLIGDSITHHWERHSELYEKYFGAYNSINLGFSGDQTQHVLWRLDNLPLDKISPKVAMVMIGTNNVGHREGTTPLEAAEGIVAIVRKLQKQYPRMQIIVLKVFPRDEKPDGEYRKRVNEINAALPSMLRRGNQGFVYLADINRVFLNRDGTLPKEIMDDFLHPGSEGYDRWGTAVVPFIERAFQRYERQERRLQMLPRLRSLRQ